jgi:hypothetical protein
LSKKIHSYTDCKNKIGIEVEFFLKKKGELVFPGDYGFAHDDYPLLGEIRTKPGTTVGEVLGSFYAEYAQVKSLARTYGLELVFASFQEISPELHRKAIKAMDNKEVAKCKNIYGTEVLDYSNDVLDGTGKKIAVRVSAGTHVHFSSQVETSFTVNGDKYERINLPLTFKVGDANLQLNDIIYRPI